MSRDNGKGLAMLAAIIAILKALGLKRSIEWGTGWTWPVPSLYVPGDPNGYPAVVSSGMDSERRNKDGSKRPHRGLDIMYRRREKMTDMKQYPAGVKSQADGFVSGSTWFFAPPGTPIVAAKDGRIWSVHKRKDGGGWTIVIDHGKPFATYYTHLASVNFREATGGKRDDGGEPEYVKAGDVIGTMGANEADSEKLRHLHFEVWHNGHGAEASVDAYSAGVMASWARKSWKPTVLPL